MAGRDSPALFYYSASRPVAVQYGRRGLLPYDLNAGHWPAAFRCGAVYLNSRKPVQAMHKPARPWWIAVNRITLPRVNPARCGPLQAGKLACFVAACMPSILPLCFPWYSCTAQKEKPVIGRFRGSYNRLFYAGFVCIFRFLCRPGRGG